MSISSEEFNGSKKEDISNSVLNFLEKNFENAYTVEEIKKHLNINLLDVMVHMDLTRLVWSDKVEYRDIYAQDGKLVRYYKIKK